MHSKQRTRLTLLAALLLYIASGSGNLFAQPRQQFPSPSGLRPIPNSGVPSTGQMVPINPSTQQSIYPSSGFGSPTFDPYANPQATPFGTPIFNAPPALPAPTAGGYPQYPQAGSPYGSFPGYNGPAPALPGAGPSATVGTFQNTGPGSTQPGVYPNSSPSALFPGQTYGTYGNNAAAPNSAGNWFNDFFSGWSTNNYYGNTYPPNGPVLPPAPGQPGYGVPNNWNPQGSVFAGQAGYPQVVRLFQGTRFRHGYVHGNNDADALMINDSDVSLAFLWPNFLFSTQPLYVLPSFSLHQWDGPKPPSTADLPALAYSAFLDSGWQSDPNRILGAELGLRVGMFTDFNTATSDSLRVMGRAIGRVRLTPRATVKGGVLYLDRNKVALLPAGGLLWQPNPDTRFDLFFPEPKLSHYLSTVGTMDTWWYAAGYYGGGSWTVERTDETTDSIDINDLRLVFGLEWGRNEQLRDGRRIGFFEVGYVFDRELVYSNRPMDNLDLQDTIMIRAGFGY